MKCTLRTVKGGFHDWWKYSELADIIRGLSKMYARIVMAGCIVVAEVNLLKYALNGSAAALSVLAIQLVLCIIAGAWAIAKDICRYGGER